MTEKEFVNAISELGIILSEEQQQQFELYYKLLVEWNQKMNLTRIIEKKEVYLKHFYDSATLLKIIDFQKQNTFCDIGTGAGFPGVVIKILFPNLQVTLVDSLNKRLVFIKEVIEKLNLKKIEIVHERAEVYSKKNREKFDIVTARAVAHLQILAEICLPLVRVNGYFIGMKGNITDEIVNISQLLNKLNSELITINEFILPIENAKRSLVLIKKKAIISSTYPRNINIIKKSI
ncbi:MAG: 16S rRNA (guanine(527)-N(7))-methyltransferase RsmG [Bacilli bacterium]|nr:16S rRNA (guanine(527)-N(7))-methyltransferase RsmG [Bacilli bacterium]